MLPHSPHLAPSITLALVALALGAQCATAQATHDAPTLTLGLSAGWTQGADFWHITNQPITAPAGQFDIFDIHRRLTGNFSFGFQATVYKSPNVGFTAEVSYLGIGTQDTCILATATGYQQSRDACTALNTSTRSTSAANFLAGVVLRPWSRALIQPYGLVRAGFSAISNNLVALTAITSTVRVPIYPSSGGLDFRPSGMIGLGLATNFGVGYQFRLEGRETWLQLSTVTGPSAHDEIAPPTGTVFKRLGSLLIGFDVILEKSRGRRY